MKLFIGCSSRNEIDNIYFDECKKYLDYLLKDNDLVFGAYNEGIMGLAYKIAKENKRMIIGVATEKEKDSFNNISCDEELVANSVIDRTEKLINLSDMIILLPGGIGSLTELACAIDSKRSNDINKPIIICNINHYYDYLINFLNKLYSEGFANLSDKDSYYVINSLEEMIELFDNLNKKG